MEVFVNFFFCCFVSVFTFKICANRHYPLSESDGLEGEPINYRARVDHYRPLRNGVIARERLLLPIRDGKLPKEGVERRTLTAVNSMVAENRHPNDVLNCLGGRYLKEGTTRVPTHRLSNPTWMRCRRCSEQIADCTIELT